MKYPFFHPRSPRRPEKLTTSQFATAFPTEGQLLEFKRVAKTDRLQEAIVAFSNSEGGVILVGVDDAGRAVGCTLTRELDRDVHQAFADVRNHAPYEVHNLSVAGLTIIVVVVHPLVQGFAQTPNGRVLVRRGPQNLALFADELVTFVNKHSVGRFEWVRLHWSDAGHAATAWLRSCSAA